MSNCSLQDRIKNGVITKATEMLTETGLFEKTENNSVVQLAAPSQNSINYTLRANKIIFDNFPKIISWENNKSINTETFWKKIQELGISKDQIELLKNSEGNNIEEKLSSFIANYSQTVEINTAVSPQSGKFAEGASIESFTYNNHNYFTLINFDDNHNIIGTTYQRDGNEIDEKYYKEDWEKAQKILKPTQHYSNLTVPGGTNYTENEILTPAITPSIPGHAAFSTPNGIGWFRSDDRGNSYKYVENKGVGRDTVENRGSRWYVTNDSIGDIADFPTEGEAYSFLGIDYKDYSKLPKTRRILEVQSDLFQKGRDRELLTGQSESEVDSDIMDEESFMREMGKNVNYSEKGARIKFDNKNQNQFLQLLMKDNNWVTFFIKSIIQDSIKKGYEKLLLPTGDTASKVEGHETLEQFKKQKEDRIRELEKQIGEIESSGLRFISSQVEKVEDNKIEITQLKQELKNVEENGLAALKPIHHFYENVVKNVLNKNYLTNQIIDEYENTWNEITLSTSKIETILLSQANNAIDDVNNQFGEQLIQKQEEQYIISPSSELINEYIGDLSVDEYTEQLLLNEDLDATSDPLVIEKYFKQSNETNVKDVLTKISQSNHPTNRIAESLLKYADVFNIPIKLVAGEFIESNNPIDSTIPIKEGVNEIFQQNPELANIGTQQEYSQYLDTIFPESKVKDIVYRGSKKEDSSLFQYFTKNRTEAYMYAKANITKGGNITERNPISVITNNLKNYINNKYGDKTFESYITDEQDFLEQVSETEYELKLPSWYKKDINLEQNDIDYINSLSILKSNYDSIKIESEDDLDKPYVVNDYEKIKKEYDNARNKLNKFFNIEELGEVNNALLNIKNPYIEEIVQEDLQNNRNAYKNNHDGAFLMDGDHFLVKSNTEQIHILGNKQDAEGFKKWNKKIQAVGLYSAYADGTADIKIARGGRFRGQNVETTIIHEIIHAYTYSYLTENPETTESKDFQKLLEHIRTNYSSLIRDKYGLQNNLELSAELFSNGSLIEDLQKLPASDEFSKYKNLWEQLLDYIMNLFSFEPREKTLYTQAFSLMTNILQNSVDYAQINQTLLDDYYNSVDNNQEFLYTEGNIGDNFLFSKADEIRNSNENIQPLVVSSLENPGYPMLYPFSKLALPDSVNRNAQGQFNSHEISQITTDKLFERLRRVFPEMIVHYIEPEELNQDDHAFPINDINAFVKNNIIYVVKNRIATNTLVEELLHPFVKGIEIKNNSLFNSLFDEAIKKYQKEFDFYKRIRGEQDAKLEIITKALTDRVETISSSLYEQFLNFLRKAFQAIFPRSKETFRTEEMPNLSIMDIARLLTSGGFQFQSHFTDRIFYSADENIEKQQDVFDRIRNFAVNNGLTKLGADEGYINKEGKKVKRTSSISNDAVAKRFRGRPRTESEKLLDKIKREYGTGAHGAIDDILYRLVDKETGFRKKGPSREPKYTIAPNLYKKLEKFIIGKLDSYDKNTKFIWEQLVYNPDVHVELNQEERESKEYTNKGLAGTIDFIAITQEAKIHVIDWKFISNTKDEPKDKHHPAWKRESYELQLSNYVDILKRATGLNETSFELVRISPFLATYNEDQSQLKDITTPDLNLKKINHRKLLPYVSLKENIDNENLRHILSKLRGIPLLYKDNKEDVKSSDYDMDIKIEDAIADYALLGSFKSMYELNVEIYNTSLVPLFAKLEAIAKKPVDSSNQNEINTNLDALSNFLDSMQLFYASAEEIYGDNLDEKSLVEKDKVEEENRFKGEIRRFHDAINSANKKLRNLRGEFLDSQARMNGITGIKSEEQAVSDVSKLFNPQSSASTRAVATLYNQTKDIYHKVNRIIQGHKNDFSKLKHDLGVYAKKIGKSLQEVSDSLLAFDDEGNFKGKFKARWDSKFYEDKTKARKTLAGAKAWYNKYYDMEAAKAHFAELVKQKHKEIDEAKIAYTDPKLANEQKKRDKLTVSKRYDLNNNLEAYDRISDKKYIQENEDFKNEYYAEWYKNMLKPENIALKNVWDKFISINQSLVDAGFLEYKNLYTFVPNIHTNQKESGLKNIVKNFKDRFKVTDEAGMYGNIDPITGKIKKEINIPYLQDYFHGDYSKKSRNLFINYLQFVEGSEKAISLKEMLPFAKNLLRLEQSKKVIKVNSFYQNVKNRLSKTEDLKEDYDVNARYFEKFMDAEFYGKELQSSLDYRWQTIDEKTGETTTYSLGKAIKEGMSWMYTTTFGLNIFSPIRNYFGGLGSTLFLSGKHFNKKDLAEFPEFIKRITSPNVIKEKIDPLIGMLVPYLNQNWKQYASDLSYNNLDHWLSQEKLMWMMETSSRGVQFKIIHALIKNSVVINGKIENVNTYVESLPEYKNFYNISNEERAVMSKEIENRKKQLLQSSSLESLTENNNGKLSIKGIPEENIHSEFDKITNLIQFYAKKATGESTQNDHMGYRMYTIGRLLSQYKNWIPRTVIARLGGTRYNSDIDSYEWGRWLSYWNAVSAIGKESKLKMVKHFLGFASKESLIKMAKDRYGNVEKKLREKNKLFTKDFISEKEFIAQYLQDYKNSVIEFWTITCMALLLFGGLMAPDDDDDDETKTLKAFARYQVDRLMDEYSFYINPSSLIDMMGTAMPATVFASNLWKVMTNTMQQLFGEVEGVLGFEDRSEKNLKAAKPLKYFFRAFPVSAEILKYIPLFDPELAKDMGIKTRTTSGH